MSVPAAGEAVTAYASSEAVPVLAVVRMSWFLEVSATNVAFPVIFDVRIDARETSVTEAPVVTSRTCTLAPSTSMSKEPSVRFWRPERSVIVPETSLAGVFSVVSSPFSIDAPVVEVSLRSVLTSVNSVGVPA